MSVKIIINPYIGYSEKLSNSLEKFGGSALPKPECENGICPILQPLKLYSKKKLTSMITDYLDEKSNEEKEILIIAANDKDQLNLVKMSKSENWGNFKNLKVRIICEIE